MHFLLPSFLRKAVQTYFRLHLFHQIMGRRDLLGRQVQLELRERPVVRGAKDITGSTGATGATGTTGTTGATGATVRLQQRHHRHVNGGICYYSSAVWIAGSCYADIQQRRSRLDHYSFELVMPSRAVPRLHGFLFYMHIHY